MISDIQTTADIAMAQSQTMTTLQKGNNLPLSAIDQKSKEFESVFMSQMIQPMFEGIGVDPVFGGGHGEEVMRSFMMQEYGKAMSARGGFGIASAVKSAMIKAQEGRNANRPSASLGAAYANAR